ncbi:MAG: hypothetical protein JNM63_17500, partial [Spirochaetia bacterium]|nr:hypothetical protein [Spirochaetia bacterium]
SLPENFERLYVPSVLWDPKRESYWTGHDEWKQRFRFWNGYRAPESAFFPLYPRQDLDALQSGLLFADTAWLDQRKIKQLKPPPGNWKVLARNGVGILYEIIPLPASTNQP